jgi:hypothetical protein
MSTVFPPELELALLLLLPQAASASTAAAVRQPVTVFEYKVASFGPHEHGVLVL